MKVIKLNQYTGKFFIIIGCIAILVAILIGVFEYQPYIKGAVLTLVVGAMFTVIGNVLLQHDSHE
jgi:hypothetical protein